MSIDEWVILIIFLATYVLIFSEKISRTTAALTGAMIAMGYGIHRGFIVEADALEFIKFDVIILLMSMMIMVNILLETGFFGYIAVKLTQVSNGNIGHLIIFLGLGTAFLSMIVDNVTTIILLIPITIEISRKLEMNPVPFLLSEAILSNVGGVATMIGDPPNIIIASYSGMTFNQFLIHLLPPVLVSGFLIVLLIRVLYKDWICEGNSCSGAHEMLDPDQEITDPITMRNTLMILTVVFSLFVFHDLLGVSPAFIAISGAGATLLVNYYDPEKVLQNVEWSVLIFFASLFILVGAMDAVGLMKDLAIWTIDVAGEDEMIAVIVIMWMTAAITAFMDNIPFTAAIAPVIVYIGDVGDMNIGPLWWAVALGVGFGGNATPIGSSAGLITVGISSKFGYDITMKEWLKIGLPSAFISLFVATVFIVLFWSFYS